MTRPLIYGQTAHHTGRRARVVVLALWCLLVMAAAAPAAGGGQSPVPDDSPWLPWLGCWHLVEETGALPERPDAMRLADRVVVCLTPAGGTADSAGMTVTTIADGEPMLVETLVADGLRRRVAETACTGWRQSTWSDDSARLFTRAELACEDEDMRRVSGVGLMSSASTWLDIQLVETGARGSLTVRRYRRAGESTTVDAGATPLPADLRERVAAAARLAGASELRIEDVVEAGHAVEAAVVEAMLVETRASFAIDRRALIQLADSGVSADVIDLMVALSFPDEFVVDRPVARTTWSGGGGGGGFFDPVDVYGYDSWYPYYASPFGYYYGWSPYSSLYSYGPAASYFIVPEERPTSSGRAYEHRGYTRVDVRQAEPERRARRRGTTGTDFGSTQAASRGGSDAGGGSSGSRGGGQATPGGYTRGGSAGRSARPRDR